MSMAGSQQPRQDPVPSVDGLRSYWRANLWLIAVLLLAWFGVTFIVAYDARDLSFNFFGWPFSFFMAAQGAPFLFLLIIWVYARQMARLDRLHGVSEPEDE